MKKPSFFWSVIIITCIITTLTTIASAAPCTVPTSGMQINSTNNVFCQGSYQLNDTGNGAIRATSTANLEGNYSIIKGNGSGNGYNSNGNSGRNVSNIIISGFDQAFQLINGQRMSLYNVVANGSSGNDYANIYVGAQNNVTIYNITSKDSNQSHGIYFDAKTAAGTNNVSLTNSYFYNHTAGAGIQINGADLGFVKNINATNNTIYNILNGIQLFAAKDSTFSNTLIANYSNIGLFFSYNPTFAGKAFATNNVTVTQMTFSGGGVADVLFDNSTYNNALINNTYQTGVAKIRARQAEINYTIIEYSTNEIELYLGSGTSFVTTSLLNFSFSGTKNITAINNSMTINSENTAYFDVYKNGLLIQSRKTSYSFTVLTGENYTFSGEKEIYFVYPTPTNNTPNNMSNYYINVNTNINIGNPIIKILVYGNSSNLINTTETSGTNAISLFLRGNNGQYWYNASVYNYTNANVTDVSGNNLILNSYNAPIVNSTCGYLSNGSCYYNNSRQLHNTTYVKNQSLDNYTLSAMIKTSGVDNGANWGIVNLQGVEATANQQVGLQMLNGTNLLCISSGSNTTTLGFSISASSSSVTILPNTWYNITCRFTRDSSTTYNVTLFVNNVMYASTVRTVTHFGSNATEIRLGAQKGVSNRYFNGSLDNVVVSNSTGVIVNYTFEQIAFANIERSSDNYFIMDSYTMRDSFESGQPSPVWASNHSCVTNHSFLINSDLAREGTKAARFQILSGDCSVVGGNRSELQAPSVEITEPYWYGFSVYVPSTNVYPVTSNASNWNIIAQWHDTPDLNIGEPYISPSIAVDIYNNSYYITTRNCSAQNCTVSPSSSNFTKVAPIRFDTWNDFVVYVNSSYQGIGGLVTVWINDVMVFNRSGPIGYNDTVGTYFLPGIYRGPQSTENQTYYFDAIRYANSSASYYDVAPSGFASWILYVNGSSGTCSDSYTRGQASNPSTPWCLISTADDKAESGDLVIVGDGVYRDVDTLDFSANYNLSTRYLAQSNNTIITSAESAPEAVPNTWWTNISNSTNTNQWARYYSTGDAEIHVEYANTSQPLLQCTASNFSQTVAQRGYECVYFSGGSNDTINIALEAGKNPREISFYVAKGDSVEIDPTSTNLILDGFTIRGGERQVSSTVSGQSKNITLQNLWVYGGGTDTGTIDFRRTIGLNIINNTIQRTQLTSWPWWLVKQSNLDGETSAINCQDGCNNTNIINNTIKGYFNGIVVFNNSAGNLQHILVETNNISDILDDAIEFEGYGNNITIRNNTINYTLVGISLTTFNNTGIPMNISFNFVIAERRINYTKSGSSYATIVGEVFKLLRNNSLYNANIDHNTLAGNIIFAGRAGAREVYGNNMRNVNVTNNAMISTLDGYILDVSGLNSSGVRYNNNLYFNQSGGGNIFRYWNSATNSASYATLAAALASSANPGTWDTASLNTNPLLETGTYRPYGNSPLVGAGTSGTTIGAFAALSSSSTITVNINASINNTVFSPILLNNLTFNYTASTSSAVCYSYVAGQNQTVSGGLLPSTNYAISVNPTPRSNGAYQMWVNCTTLEGLEGTSGKLNISYYNNVPAVSNVGNETISYNYFVINWTRGSMSNYSTTKVFVNGVNVGNTTNEFYNATGLLPNTAYSITINNTDQFGNENATYNAITTSSFNTLQVGILAPLNQTVLEGTLNYTISYQVNGTDPAYCSVYANNTLLEVQAVDAGEYNANVTVSAVGTQMFFIVCNDTVPVTNSTANFTVYLQKKYVQSNVTQAVNISTASYQFENNTLNGANPATYQLVQASSPIVYSTNPKLGSYAFEASVLVAAQAQYSGSITDDNYPVSFFTWKTWDEIPTSDRVFLAYGRANHQGSCGIDGGNEVILGYDQTVGGLRFGSGCAGHTAYTFTPTIGDWYHIGVVYNGSNGILLYLNGQNVANYTISGTMRLNTSTLNPSYLSVGRSQDSSSYTNTGRFDDTRFYVNQTLTATQVLEIYNNGSGTTRDPIQQGAELITPTPSNGQTVFSNTSITVNTQVNNITGGSTNVTNYIYNASGSIVYQDSGLTTTNYSSTFPSGIAMSGTYYINATVQNSTHYSSTLTRTITVYGLAVTIVEPTNNQSFNRTLLIDWVTAITEAGVTVNRTEIKIDGVNVVTLNDASSIYLWNNTYNWNLSIGQHTLNISVYDSTGNLTSASQTVYHSRNTLINITARTVIGNNTINYLSGWLYNAEYDLNQSYTNESGQALVDFIRGNVTAYLDSTNYTLNLDQSLASFNVSTSQYNHQFYLYDANSLNITFYYESSPTTIVVGPAITLDLIGSSYSNNYSTTNGTMYLTGLTPDTYTLRYVASGFSERFYTVTVTNRSFQSVQLYMINGTASSNITITVVNEVLNPVQSAVVKALKYDLASNTYILQEIATTNVEGKVIMSLTLNNEYYKFIVEYPSGTVKKITDPAYITSTSIVIPIDFSSDITEEFNEYRSISYGLTFNTASLNFRLDYSDGNNLASEYCLYIYQYLNGSQTLYNTTCTTGASGTLLAGVQNVSGAVYVAKATYVEDSVELFLASEDYEFPLLEIIKTHYNLFLQLLLSLGFMAFFMLNIAFGLIMLPFSLILGKIIGLNAFTWVALLSLQTAFAIAGIYISNKR